MATFAGSHCFVVVYLVVALGNSDSEHLAPIPAPMEVHLATSLTPMEEALHPLFAVVPKNAQGKLEPATARYVLHRFFVRRHSWFVKGLEPHGGSWNDSLPTESLRGHVSPAVLSFFEGHLAHGGLDLSELAALASTVERLVHDDLLDGLGKAYALHGYPLEFVASGPQAQGVMETYCASLLLGVNLTQTRTRAAVTPLRGSRLQISKLRQNIASAYPGWPALRGIISDVRIQQQGLLSGLTFGDVSTILAFVLDKFGEWQGQNECLATKNMLLTAEELKTGCVLLADFYGKLGLEGKWQFTESPDYLRKLGALDESDPANPRVLVANYIQGASNCIASTTYYSLCCKSECDNLFSQLEHNIGSSRASPAQIASVVASLPSATVRGNRTLPISLLQRLDEIAQFHGDAVPLHGRLFAQWMHHAYPRECPFPHISGVTQPEDLWHEDQGFAASSESDMQRMVSRVTHANTPSPNLGTCVPWQHNEELIARSERPMAHIEAMLARDRDAATAAQGTAMTLAIACMLLIIMRQLLYYRRRLRKPRAAAFGDAYCLPA